jgi:hypothetical protein
MRAAESALWPTVTSGTIVDASLVLTGPDAAQVTSIRIGV